MLYNTEDDLEATYEFALLAWSSWKSHPVFEVLRKPPGYTKRVGLPPGRVVVALDRRDAVEGRVCPVSA